MHVIKPLSLILEWDLERKGELERESSVQSQLMDPRMSELSQDENPERKSRAQRIKMGITHQRKKDPDNPEEPEER